MTVRVESLDGAAAARWNDYLDRSRCGSPFHQLEGLRVLIEHTNTDLHLLAGFADREPVGLFPVAELSLGVLSAVFSPPPNVRIPALGPVRLETDRKRRAAERSHREFVDGCREWIEEHISPRYSHFRTTTRYTDLRPFQWNGFEVTPEYTYLVDIDRDEEELLSSFSRDARANIRADGAENCRIEVGAGDAIDWVIEQVRQRFAAQDLSYNVTPAYVRSLYESLPDGQVRPYLCRLDGDPVAGMVTLEYGDVIYRWQGGVRQECDLPVNDILDWYIMRDARERGIRTYDLVGANTPSLCRYKAKFGPRLASYHALERGTRLTSLASGLYKRFR